jgi:4-hydroxy-2-oxoheptanedioate aldolase
MKLSPEFRQRVLTGDFVGGTFLNLGSPLTAEMAGAAGFDWVLLDYEHGPGDDSTLLHQLQAVQGTAAVPIVRIAANETPRFKRVLDAGAAGVMVPYVNTADEAAAAVHAMRYPPHGVRGVSKMNRASGFGVHFDAALAHSHEWLVTMVQIETREAVENIDAIAAVEGADVLFVGPLDLSTNYGISGNYTHPDFVELLRRVATAARRAGKAAGILALDGTNVAPWRALGYSVMALGSDGGAANAGLRAAAAALRKG